MDERLKIAMAALEQITASADDYGKLGYWALRYLANDALERIDRLTTRGFKKTLECPKCHLIFEGEPNHGVSIRGGSRKAFPRDEKD